MVSARFAAVRLLPSPLFGLVTAIVRSARPLSLRLILVRSDRYCSAASDVGDSAATRCGSSCAIRRGVASWAADHPEVGGCGSSPAGESWRRAAAADGSGG